MATFQDLFRGAVNPFARSSKAVSYELDKTIPKGKYQIRITSQETSTLGVWLDDNYLGLVCDDKISFTLDQDLHINEIIVKDMNEDGTLFNVEIGVPTSVEIAEGMIALVDTKSKGAQPFVINNITKTPQRLEFKASHVVFESKNYILEDVRPTNMSAVGALQYVNERTDISSPFSVTSNVSNSETAYFIRRTLLEAFTTIENRWGGQFDVDGYSLNLKDTIGVDRGYSIRYGKNLQDIKVFEDWSDVVTKLLPVGYDGITLPETYLHSDKSYDKPYTKIIKFDTELEADEETNEYDTAALITELRNNATKYIAENEVPKVSYEVVSDINQEMDIGDKIQVVHPIVGMIETEVISYEYNPITKRTTKLIFGNYVRSVKSKVDKIKQEIERVTENTSGLESILADQTDLINNMNKNGHVYIDDNQILILDDLPKENANNVWRWNMGGLAFSENGVEGPFKQAWTMDGTFNTEFISANSITANQLQSDVGSSLDLSSNESINAIVENVADLDGNFQTRASQLELTQDSLMTTITQIAQGQEANEDEIELIKTHFRIDENGIILGKSNNPIEFYAEPDEVGFRENGVKIAYWKEGTMNVDNLIAIMTIIVGYHQIEKYDSQVAGKTTIVRLGD